MPGSICSARMPTSLLRADGLVHQPPGLVDAARCGRGRRPARRCRRRTRLPRRRHAGVAVEQRRCRGPSSAATASMVAARRVAAVEAGPPGEQDGGVEVVGAGVERVGLLGLRPAVLFDPGRDRSSASARQRAARRRRSWPALGEPGGPVEGDPAAHLGDGVVLRGPRAPRCPESLGVPDARSTGRRAGEQVGGGGGRGGGPGRT